MQNTASRSPAARLGIILPAGVLLILGMAGGMQLLGIPLPAATARLADLHAPLMVLGFVGTVISLERAVALRAIWAYFAPLFIVAGAVSLLFVPGALGAWAITAGLSVHVVQYVAIWRRQQMTATAIQGLGALLGALAGLLWAADVPIPNLVPLLAMFLVLTIGGERLELARVAAPPTRAQSMLLMIAVLIAIIAVLTVIMPAIALPGLGVGLLAMVVWLLRYDIIRMTARQGGLPRFVAYCLYAGYAWLAVAGIGWLLGGAHTEGVLYDATTHAIFLGFVITAIMAHAPLILPGMLGVGIPFHPALYAPAGLLHASLLVRVIGGDAWGSTLALQVGGVGAVAAIVLFALTAVTVSVRVATQRKRHERVTA